MHIFCFEKNIYLNSIKNDHADDCRSGCGLIRSILGILELSSEKNHNFITIWKSWLSYEFPLSPDQQVPLLLLIALAITFSEWATLAQDRAGWMKLVTKVPFDLANRS